ncbi:MAG: hypothetical protein ABI689_14215 [Thermoanaerobaculia bacterium]
MRILSRACLTAAVTLAALASLLPSRASAAEEKPPGFRVATPSAQDCALLDDPKIAGRMDGLLTYLAIGCGRQAEFIGNVREEGGPEGLNFAPAAVDAPVSNPTQDTSGTAKTESETSIAFNPTTGTLCAAWNDSFHGFTEGHGYSGFGRSLDNGATWVDKGAVTPTADFNTGDPSLVWRKLDGKFYYAALKGGGLGVYRSDDDCNSFTFVANISTGNDDKEIMAVDNNVTSPYYGRLYVTWTDFGLDARIYATTSSNAGATWTPQVAISTSTSVQGSWPVVAPNGDVYAAWVAWLGAGFPNGNIEIQVARTTNGGTSWSLVTPPMTNQVNPREAAAQSFCLRPALKGNIRYLPSPTIAVDAAGVLHAVYTYDPDATGVGDTVNVYYRRSLDNGATWQTEVQVNDDATTTDQYQPSLSVGEGNVLAIGYYSRQNDANNLLLDYYSRVSYDGGATFQPSTRLSDVSSSVVLDPNLADCYHGDYDTQIHRPGAAQYLWSDDRNPGTGADPNVYTESTPAGTDFLVASSAASQTICVPASGVFPLNVFQFQGFTENVTLSATGNPGATTTGFAPNPVAPGGTSTLTIGNTGALPFGTSTITVTGTSSPTAIVHSTTVSLTAFPASPAAATLTLPANGAVTQPLKPTFTWTAPAEGASSYLLQVDDNSDFSSVTYSATVSGTSHVPATDLASNTHFYWRVQATNACGTGSFTGSFDFTTVPLPGDCPSGATAVDSYPQGFESGLGSWALGTGSISNTWAVSTARFHSGTSSFKAIGNSAVSDQRLVTGPITVPTGAGPQSVIFWHYRDLEESGATACFDGGIVEISTNGGSTFTQLTSQVLVDPYTGVISSSFSNPLAGLNAWCNLQDWTRVVVDVSGYAGQSVQLRFRVGNDSSVGAEGWYLDDFKVQNCSALVGLFSDGFETGNTSLWSLSFP